MKARLPKGYGRPDPNAMMRQVQKMQDDIRAQAGGARSQGVHRHRQR